MAGVSLDQWRKAFEDALAKGLTERQAIIDDVLKTYPAAPPTINQRFHQLIEEQTGPTGPRYVMRTSPIVYRYSRDGTSAPPTSSTAAATGASPSVTPEPSDPVPSAPPTSPVVKEQDRERVLIEYRGNDEKLKGTLWRLRTEDLDLSENADPWEVTFPTGAVWNFDVPKPEARRDYMAREIGTTTDIRLIQDLLSKKRPLLIIGHLGVGKTSGVIAAVADPDWEENKAVTTEGWDNVGRTEPWRLPRVYRAVMSQLQYEQLIGSVVPNPNRERAKDEPFVWEDGILTKMVRYGGTFFADEINLTAPDVLAAMNSLLDASHSLLLAGNGGRLIYAHPNFRLVAAMNPTGFGYIGTKQMNAALKSRFKYHMWYSWAPDVEKERVVKPDQKLAMGNTGVDVHLFFAELRSIFVENNLHYPPGQRDMMNFVANLTDYGPDNALRSLLLLYETDEERKLVWSSATKLLKGISLQEDDLKL